ncbi:MAG: BTAD domain-containing putative transcriptional regulator [Aerococcus suis]|nr:BTAD domain-containing putative transcriptional regulator [Aerococcus suis]
MNHVLYGQLLGNPIIYLDDEMIHFPFAKINALVYYLLINQTVSREEMASLLWPDKTETSAKKNLRNTIYQANKTLGDDYIVSLANQILAWNDALPIELDVDHLLNDDPFNPDIYQDEFLHQFYIKGCERYDNWLNQMRRFYAHEFTKKLYAKVQHDIEQKNFAEVERYIHRLTSIDEFDEHYYQLLMNYYHQRGMYSKVIETYMHLSQLLNQELGITPTAETEAIYKETISEVQKSQHHKKNQLPDVYFSRPEAMATYEEVVDRFVSGNTAEVLLIYGETGNGKTEFVERMQQISTLDVLNVAITAKKMYAKNSGYVWDKWLTRLADVLQNCCEKEVSDSIDAIRYHALHQEHDKEVSYTQVDKAYQTLKPLLMNHKVIVTIDQFEQIDVPSLKLMHLLVSDYDLPILFIWIGNGQTLPETQQIINQLRHTHFCHEIEIKPLTLHQTEHFITNLLENKQQTMPQAEKEAIYHFSGGNILFIHEMVNLYMKGQPITQLTDKMAASIDKQCSFLSQDGIELLETLALFQKGVTMPLLSSLIGLNLMPMKRELKELFRRNLIIEETHQGALTIRIKAERIKHYFDEHQNKTLKKLMHGKIADTLIEHHGVYLTNTQDLSQIAYHLRHADRVLEALEYELAYLQHSLKFRHELFPVYNQEQNGTIETLNFTPAEVEERLEMIQQELTAIENSREVDIVFLKLELRFLYIQGRYFIRIGSYEEGIDNILAVIVKAKEINESDYLLRAYFQMIYYCIQMNKPEDMQHYVQFAFDLAVQLNDYESIGVILRLKGLQEIMVGEISLAEAHLKESIKMLTINPALETKYAINLAAAYDYLSEIALIRENYTESIALQEVALDYIKGKDIPSSDVVLSLDMGIALFAIGDYQAAQTYLDRALAVSKNLNFFWRRPQLLAFIAINSLFLGDVDKGYHHLVACQEFLKPLSKANKRDRGILYWLKAMILVNEETAQLLSGTAKSLLDSKEEDFYIEQAEKNLSPYRDAYERKVLFSNIKNK